jgi:hypothetical protein
MGLTRIRAEQISDIDYKQAVRVITLTDITLSGGAPAEVDGVSLITGDRILVAGQSDAAQNGLYQVQTVGAGSNGTWVRTSDANQDGEIQPGMVVMVTQGTVYADTPWKLTTNGTIEIGVTELIFAENYSLAFGNVFANGTAVIANTVSAAVTLTAGDNISIVGNNTAKSITIGVTGITTSRIANGTSNVDIAVADGNVTTTTNGNTVLTITDTGANVTGYITVTGNVTGGNLISASLGSAGNTAIIGTNNTLTSTSSLYVDTANNRIGVGTVTPERTFDLVGNAAFTGDVQITQFNDSSDSGGIRVRKSRGADNAPSAVIDNDIVGSIEFFLRDTSAFQQRASITSVSQVSGSTYGADLAFGTGNGAGPTTRLYIAEGGAITFNGAYTFPTADGSANTVLATNGTGTLSFTGTPTFSSVTTTGNVTGGNLETTGRASIDDLVITGDITGNLLPSANVTYDLGSDTARWNDLWLANSTIYIGNGQISANTTSLVLTNPDGSSFDPGGGETIGGNLVVLTRDSGNVNFAVIAGYLEVVGRSGNVSIPLAA